jgi:DNA-binding CsgD family transcriptional regulator
LSQSHFSDRLFGRILLDKGGNQPVAITSWNCKRLTPREAQIAELVAQGLTSAEIGAALWITENTVKQALKRMFRKLQVSSRAEMVAQLSGSQLARSC